MLQPHQYFWLRHCCHYQLAVLIYPRPRDMGCVLQLCYASWFLGKQRTATTPLQRMRFCEIVFSSAHVLPVVFASVSILLRQFCFSRPTFCFPCGFQLRACLVTFEPGLWSLWLMYLHFPFLSSESTWACLVLSQSCLLEITSGHLILRMFLRPLLMNVWSLWVLDFVTRQVSEP